MKKYFIIYRPFIKFLLVFFVTYGVLSVLYNLYLSQYENNQYPLDPFTENISYQVKKVSNFLGWNTEIFKISGEKWTRLVFNEKYVAKIVEGCNAIRSEEHTSELQSRPHLVCRLLLEKKKKKEKKK